MSYVRFEPVLLDIRIAVKVMGGWKVPKDHQILPASFDQVEAKVTLGDVFLLEVRRHVPMTDDAEQLSVQPAVECGSAAHHSAAKLDQGVDILHGIGPEREEPVSHAGEPLFGILPIGDITDDCEEIALAFNFDKT